jgi:hypothetical protein
MTYQYTVPDDSPLAFPLKRFFLKLGREGEIALLQRYAISRNGFFDNPARQCKLYYECLTLIFSLLFCDGVLMMIQYTGTVMRKSCIFLAWPEIWTVLLELPCNSFNLQGIRFVYFVTVDSFIVRPLQSDLRLPLTYERHL